MPGMWVPDIENSAKPHYLAIADAIAEDVRIGRLRPADRLPPQRALAERLALNFTTVARGYAEAQRRGLIDSRVGQGTFVRGTSGPAIPSTAAAAPQRRHRPADLTMNLPPEPEDPALIERMQRGLVEIGREIVDLMRYQEFGGAIEDREAGVAWLAKRGLAVGADRLLVCPGAHSALLAVLSNLASAGDTVCCELLTYPGIRAWASQLGLNLVGLAMDGEGIEADAFEAACRAHAPKALYCNPTLLNPTTATISARRRRALAEIARRNGVAIVEDDAYGLLPVDPPPAFAELAPDITFHVTGLAKTLGAGLRLAYLVLPDARKAWPLRTSLRAATVMASPLSAALATRWITDGTGDALLQAIRRESAARQRLAAGILPAGIYATTPEAFHLWLTLPAPWSRSSFAAQMRSSGLGVVVSDAFYAAPGAPPEAARICLGGALNRAELSHALEFLAHVLSESPAMVSGII